MKRKDRKRERERTLKTLEKNLEFRKEQEIGSAEYFVVLKMMEDGALPEVIMKVTGISKEDFDDYKRIYVRRRMEDKIVRRMIKSYYSDEAITYIANISEGRLSNYESKMEEENAKAVEKRFLKKAKRILRRRR